MSHIELPRPPESAIAELHRTVVASAQQYVDGTHSPGLVHHSLREYVEDYREHLLQKNTRDPAFEKIQLFRILREALIAALGRILGDGIIRQVLTYSHGERLDADRMTRDHAAVYAWTFGMVDFLEETVDAAVMEMTNHNHPYRKLLNLYCVIDTEYLTILGNHAKRMGAINKKATMPYHALLAMFAENYYVDVTSLVIMHGISIQDYYGELPDAATSVASTAEARPHWLALASTPRKQMCSISYGTRRYKLLVEEAQRSGAWPTWSGYWAEGLIGAVSGVGQPFARCPMQSPLLYRRPGDVIVTAVPGTSRCAGQIALSSTPEANERAKVLSYLLGGEMTQDGKFSPAGLITDLGRHLSKRVFQDQACRAALIQAKLARDRVATI